MFLSERFNSLMDRIAKQKDIDLFEDIYKQLSASYKQVTRHYHTLKHIEDCLNVFKEVSATCPNPNAVEYAIWYHDIVYEPMGHDNEALSTHRAHFDAGRIKADQSLVKHIERLIMATQHKVPPVEDDEKCICDCDLAILGADDASFAHYEEGIRKEYPSIPEIVFREERIKILERFLKRDRIFHTALLFDKYEKKARINLEKSIALLSKMPG